MIRSKSVECGFALADEFADEGLTIVPVANTPLAYLYNATNDLACCYQEPGAAPDAAGIVDNALDAAQLVQHLAHRMEVNSTNAYKLHDQEMDKFIEAVRVAVSRHLDIAKNTVTPLVLELAEKTMESFNNDVAANPIDDFNIVNIEPCPLLALDAFINSLVNYNNRIPAIPKAYLRIKQDKDLSEAAVRDIVLDTYPDLKAELIDWFDQIDLGGNIHEVRLCYSLGGFMCMSSQNIADTIAPNSYDIDRCGDDVTILSKLIILYIVAVYLFDRPEYGDGYSLSAYKEAVAQIRDYAAMRICQYMKRVEMLNRSKTIILSTIASQNTIRVNGPVYRMWLQEGGSPEVLYSIMLSNAGMVTMDTINQSKAVLLERWKKFNTLREVAFKNASLQRFKDHLAYTFIHQLNDVSDIELAYFNNDKRKLMSEVMKRFEEGLTHVKMHSMENIYKTARKLVCRARFYYTSSDKILAAIEEYTNANPDIDSQEAALMATIEYVADFVAEQLTITTRV